MNNQPEKTPKVCHWSSAYYRNLHLLIMTLIVIAAAGFSAWNSLPKIEDPRITQRNISVITEFPGASARLVEASITELVESSIASISEIKTVNSTSRANVSIVAIELQDNITRVNNRQIIARIRDRVKEVTPNLPEGAKAPSINEEESIASAYTLITALSWNGEGEPQLSLMNRVAESLKDRLEAVAGTEYVSIHGEPVEEILVEVSPEELADMGMTIGQLANLVDASDSKQVAGRLLRPNASSPVEVRGEFNSLERIRTLPIRSNTADTRLSDIATVSKSHVQPEDVMTYFNGEQVILVAARIQVKSQIRPWTELIKAELANVENETGHLVKFNIAFEQANYTEGRLATLGMNLLAGVTAVLLVVLFFMGWRSGIIVATSLPLSAACVLFALQILDMQIQQMSIFGMIIAIGLLIDNAIVMTDEVRTRIEHGRRPVQAIEESVKHLFTPLLASTLTTIFAFMPILLLQGGSGDFIGSISVSVILALISSFAISMTIIPALSAWLESKRRSGSEHEQWWKVGIQGPAYSARFSKFLLISLKRPFIAIITATLISIMGVVAVGTLPKVFFPAADRDMFEIRVWFPNNVTVPVASEWVQKIDKLILEKQKVTQTVWSIGDSIPSFYYNQIMNNSNSPFYAEVVVSVEDSDDSGKMIDILQGELDKTFPNLQIVAKAFAQGPPVESPIEFRLFGPETNTLRRLGEEMRAIIAKQTGTLHIRASVSPGLAKVWFDADESALNQVGLRLSDVAAQFSNAYEGLEAGSILEDIVELPVRIKYANSERDELEDLRTFPIVLPSGEWAPASAFGNFIIEPDSTSITRQNGERVNIVQAYIASDITPLDLTNKVIKVIEEENWQLPEGYRWEVGGDAEKSGDANASLAAHLPVLILLMVTSLVLAFKSGKLAGIIGMVAILSAGFGLLSLWISGYALGFNPLLGVTGLIGVAINGSIVILAGIQADEKAKAGDHQAIVDVTLSSTRHIMSTTLTTIAGFIPLILFVGGQFWPPLAVVIAGGVGFSIILSLWFTPSIYALMNRNKQNR
ncbi:MAG: multidrug efflux pump subunit AcrB [Oleiphilaceae bacterium]|jgi:multidrug efflux pump subunit AcrB